MLKGIQQSMRNQGWHNSHAKQLRRRKRIRQLHIDRNRAFMTDRHEQQKELETKSKEMTQKKDWGRLMYFLMGLWFKLTNPFRYLIRAIRYKYGNVQTQAKED